MDERKAGSWIEFGKILFFAKLTKRLLGGARINFNEGQGVVGKVTRGPNCVVIFITFEGSLLLKRTGRSAREQRGVAGQHMAANAWLDPVGMPQ